MKHLLLILSFLLLSSPLFGQSFVSVGNSGTILTSSDGILWTKRTSGKWKYLSGVTSGNGLFVTVGSLSGIILTSPDGNSWTKIIFWNIKVSQRSHLRKRTLRNGGFFWNHPHFPGWNHLD